MPVIEDKTAGLTAFVSTVEDGLFQCGIPAAWYNALCHIESVASGFEQRLGGCSGDRHDRSPDAEGTAYCTNAGGATPSRPEMRRKSSGPRPGRGVSCASRCQANSGAC
jgi:hypothetical protein